MGGVPLPLLVGRAAELHLAPAVADVARAVHRLQVEHRRAADGRGEAVGLPDGPRDHVPAVARTVDTEPLAVDVWTLERLVEHGHQVVEVLAAPVLAHAQGEAAPVARRPT